MFVVATLGCPAPADGAAGAEDAEDLAEHFALGPSTGLFRHQAVVTMRGAARDVTDEVPPTTGMVGPIDADARTVARGVG